MKELLNHPWIKRAQVAQVMCPDLSYNAAHLRVKKIAEGKAEATTEETDRLETELRSLRAAAQNVTVEAATKKLDEIIKA